MQNRIYPLHSTIPIIPIQNKRDTTYECAVGIVWGSIGCMCCIIVIILLLSIEKDDVGSGSY